MLGQRKQLRGLDRARWRVHSAESAPLAASDLMDDLRLRRGGGEDKRREFSQHVR